MLLAKPVEAALPRLQGRYTQLAGKLSTIHTARPIRRVSSHSWTSVSSRGYLKYVASVPEELASKLREDCQHKRRQEGGALFLPNATAAYLTLTNQERKLFAFLKETMRTKYPQAQLRVAGGWVRDKLLGVQSGDIDIAVDVVSGVRLSHLIEERFADIYATPADTAAMSINEVEKTEPLVAGVQLPSISVTKLNPDQSKHLETAIMKLYGLELNFAQLRTDSYDLESRIPQIKNASPMEDAFRRDFTINSIFYNIMTDTIEDFTGRGIASLLSRSVNTPLPPLETLKDDPLRALRAIRFAARLGFDIEPTLLECIKDPKVHHMLVTKVTPPRIGVELQKMLSPYVSSSSLIDTSCSDLSPSSHNLNTGHSETAPENNPMQALSHLVETGLYKIIFNSASWQLEPGDASAWTPESTQIGTQLCNYLYHIFNSVDRHRAEVSQTMTSMELSVMLTMAFLHPIIGHTYNNTEKEADHGRIAWVNAFKASLQYPLHQVFAVTRAMDDLKFLPGFVDDIFKDMDSQQISGTSNNPTREIDASSKSSFSRTSSTPPSHSLGPTSHPLRPSSSLPSQVYLDAAIAALQDDCRREKLGIWLRSAPPCWRSYLLWSRVLRLPNTAVDFSKELPPHWLMEGFTRELALIDAVEQSGLLKARTIKPFFDGHQLQQLLGIPRGPAVGETLRRQIAYQVVHLDASKSDIERFLLTLKKQTPPL